jgi:large subunit ribosomal protein L24
MARRIRRGDIVAVVSGEDRGKRGRVLQVISGQNRVIVEGVNLVYKHLRKSQDHPQGGRIRREAAVSLSNVMPVDSETNRPTRVASRVVDGKRTRVGVRSGAEVGKAASQKAASQKASGKGGKKKKED